MCLESKEKWAFKCPGTGYKLFVREDSNRKYTSVFNNKLPYDYCKIGDTVDDTSHKMLEIHAMLRYKTGFHIFKNFRDAIKHCGSINNGRVVEVKYSKVTAIGKQWDCDVVVARRMKLIKER